MTTFTLMTLVLPLTITTALYAITFILVTKAMQD